MRVGQRLFLAVIPAVLGVFTVVALAYFGQYARTAPLALIIIAIIAAIASLVVAWRNTRYVAQRIEQLAGEARQNHVAHTDELDDIEHGVRETRALAEQRSAMYVKLLNEVLRVVPARLEESQLPLHILLESPFGELNENQEELLGAAQSAVEAADLEVRRLRKLLDLEQGAIAFVIQPVGIAELLRAPLAIAAARADKRGVGHDWSVPTTMPRVRVDLSHMQEALTSALGHAIDQTPDGERVVLKVTEAPDGARVVLTISHGSRGGDFSTERLLAQRTIELQGGAMRDIDGSTTIELSAERLDGNAGGTGR
jgi:signal transduction histidine kinase